MHLNRAGAVDLLKQDNLLPEYNTNYGQIVALSPPISTLR